MQHPQVAAIRPPQQVGEIINSKYALQLIQDFKNKFPGEVSMIPIAAKTIFDSVKGLHNVSGIRFMYGMQSSDDPASRLILLIPCNNTSTGQAIPNTIVQPEGYLAHIGERVSLKRTWQLLYNHAVHYARLQPAIKFNKILRGGFFGIDSLTDLLTKHSRAHSINFHFGFDEDITDLPLRHKAVLQPLHAGGTPYHNYFDTFNPCPPATGCTPVTPGSTECVVTAMVERNTTTSGEEEELNIYRGFRDDYFLKNPDNGPLIEMYYYISPALIEAIENTSRAKDIYEGLYRNQVSQCNQLIEKGHYEAARTLFEQTMQYLMKEYLF